MGLFSRLFGAGSSPQGRAAPAGNIDPGNIQSRIETGFGLRYLGTGWSYGGKVADNLPGLGDPKVVFLVIKKLREKAPFDQIAVMATSPIAIACNSRPPMFIGTSLKGEGLAELQRAIVEAGAKLIGEYKGAFLWRMP